MEKTKELENLILKQIEIYLEAEEANMKAPLIIVPPLPVKQKAYFIQEYEDYKKKKSEYDSAVNRRHRISEESKHNMITAKRQIISLLPSANTWFKIGNYHVGYETDDWPASEFTFYLEVDADESKLVKLKHRTIN